MSSIIQSYGLTKTYGSNCAVNKVSMSVNEGDIYGFIGSNGAGKTTFIRLIMGLIKPTEGRLELFGKSQPAELVKARAQIGCIVETPSLMLNMTAHDCLNTQRLLYGIDNKSIIDDLLKLVELQDTGKKRVVNFSLGMKQRLSIAQALLNNPKLLILDEPTNGMDPQGIVEMRHLLKRLRDERGVTILISSHILTELQQLATRFGIIKKGVLIDEITTEQFKNGVALNLVISVSDLPMAVRALKGNNVSSDNFKIDSISGNIRLNENIFYETAKILVANDIRFGIVEKSQSSLEDYFINKVGEAHA